MANEVQGDIVVEDVPANEEDEESDDLDGGIYLPRGPYVAKLNNMIHRYKEERKCLGLFNAHMLVRRFEYMEGEIEELKKENERLRQRVVDLEELLAAK